MHAFRADAAPDQRTVDVVNVTKNIARLGGVAFIAALPRPWHAALTS
jgi:hypothetical protein